MHPAAQQVLNAVDAFKQFGQLHPFNVTQRAIANPHEFQFYVHFGMDPGPWVQVGLNHTEYVVGFVDPDTVPYRGPRQQ